MEALPAQQLGSAKARNYAILENWCSFGQVVGLCYFGPAPRSFTQIEDVLTAVRAATGAAVEVLVPDFLDKPGALERLMEAKPDVFNHNTETVPRLYRSVRGRKSVYAWTLRLLADAKRLFPDVKTKSGLMLGLGETRDELLDVFADLVEHGVDFLTLGQYLQPTLDSLPVERYIPPEEFVELGELARSIGFRKVASGPLVRSSYHARDMAEDSRL